MKVYLSTLLELLGLLGVLVGGFAFHWALGVLVTGVVALFAGWQLGSGEVES